MKEKLTNKLTKNDSMCKGEQEFKTIVAAFEAILSRNGLYIDYFASWGKRKELRYGDTLYSQWLEWARPREPKKWIIAAFLFDAQNIPEMVWYDIDGRWNVWLEYNFKK